MNIELNTEPLTLNLHGFSGIASSNEYAATAFRLMDRMWKIVNSNNLKNKGLNIWVYEPGQTVFAGVELEDVPGPGTGLESKIITLPKYASHKHIGPYSLIKQAGQIMTAQLKTAGHETILPYIEIYGHWTNDESKLETELLMTLK